MTEPQANHLIAHQRSNKLVRSIEQCKELGTYFYERRKFGQAQDHFQEALKHLIELIRLQIKEQEE